MGANGRPSTRIVLIKGFDARGIVWYTNYDSRKGRELAVHPFAALQFHWVELERVVRQHVPHDLGDAWKDAANVQHLRDRAEYLGRSVVQA